MKKSKNTRSKVIPMEKYYNHSSEHEKKEELSTDEEDNQVSLYSSTAGRVCVEYKVAGELLNLEGNFEERVRKFLENTKPDKYNADFYDAIIDKVERIAQDYLRYQRREHVGAARTLDTMLWKSEYIRIKNKLDQTEKDLKRVDEELAVLREVRNKGTSLEGRL